MPYLIVICHMSLSSQLYYRNILVSIIQVLKQLIVEVTVVVLFLFFCDPHMSSGQISGNPHITLTWRENQENKK